MEKGIAPEGIFDYFAGEVFGRTEKRTQDFLLKTAFMPTFSISQAENLTGIGAAGGILTTLTRQHYFTQQLSGSGPGYQHYQYHPLFRDFLISRARLSFAPDELSLLLSITSLILAESGEMESAVSLLAEVMDWDKLVRVIIGQAGSLMAEGRIVTLEAWLRRLSDETLESDPQLLHLLGLCRMPFDSKESRSLFEKAFLAFEAMKDTNGALMACFAIMDAILAQGADYKALGKWIDWLDRVEERGFSFPSLELELEAASKMLFATYYQPWHPRMGHWRSRAEALIACDIDTPHLIAAGMFMIMHYVFFGMMRKAAVLLETLRPRVASKDVRPFYRVQWQMAEILYAIYGSASSEAYLEETGKGKALSLQTGIPIFDRFFFYYEIIGGLIAGNTSAVERLLREMDSPEYNSNDRSFHIIYLFMLVWKDLA